MNDKVLLPNLTVPNYNPNSINVKAPYVIEFANKTAFLCIEKPSTQNSHVEAKGIHLDKTEFANLKTNKDLYKELLSKTNKDSIVEIIFPWTNIVSIQNLLYKAYK